MSDFLLTVTAAFPIFILIAAVCGASYVVYTLITWWEARDDDRVWRPIAERAKRGWRE